MRQMLQVRCQESYPAIQAAGAEVVAAVVAPLDAVEGLCRSAGITYTVLSDADHEVSDLYGVYDLLDDGLATPAVFIIDTDGTVLWSQIGQRTQVPVPGATILEHLP